MTLLDVGCGPGTITADLGGLVASVTAVEHTAEALGLARAEAARRGVPMTFDVADVHALPYADNTFDVVHLHQVLQHVHDPVQALRECRRVCRSGGLVAARDSDYAAFTWYPADPLLDRWLELYHDAARANGGEPDAGRRLLAWAHAAGFTDVSAGASVWCFADPGIASTGAACGRTASSPPRSRASWRPSHEQQPLSSRRCRARGGVGQTPPMVG